MGVFQARSLGDLEPADFNAHYSGDACVGLVLALVANSRAISLQDRFGQRTLLQTS